MKPSKNAMFNYKLGAIIAIVFLSCQLILSFTGHPVDIELTALILAGTSLLWVVGVQKDLYSGKEEEKKPHAKKKP